MVLKDIKVRRVTISTYAYHTWTVPTFSPEPLMSQWHHHDIITYYITMIAFHSTYDITPTYDSTLLHYDVIARTL